MKDTAYKNNQIIRKDAKGCFVESLSDYFGKGRAHLVFASYDMSLPPGQRQTNNINIFIGVDELQEICRKIAGGELRFQLNQRVQANDYNTSLMEWLGGTSAAKLAQYGKPRADGKSLSRTAKVLPGKKTDLLFVADSGPGEQNQKGLIVPRFGKNPENHVAVSMAFDSFSELFLMTKEHYQAWLSASYLKEMMAGKTDGDSEETEGWQSAEWPEEAAVSGQTAPSATVAGPAGQAAGNQSDMPAGAGMTAPGRNIPSGAQGGNVQTPVQGYPAGQYGNVTQMPGTAMMQQTSGRIQPQQAVTPKAVYQQAPGQLPQLGQAVSYPVPVQQMAGQYKQAS